MWRAVEGKAGEEEWTSLEWRWPGISSCPWDVFCTIILSSLVFENNIS